MIFLLAIKKIKAPSL